MLVYALWLSTLGLISFLIGVAICRRFFSKYRAFYLYLTFLLMVGILRYYIYTVEPNEYLRTYWWTEFLIVSAGFCVIWEIFNHTLGLYPGVLKMARFLVSAAFVVVVGRASVGAVGVQASDFVRSVVRLERNMITFQAVLLVLLVTLIVYYSIPLGRNLFGLLCGYCLSIGTSVILLTLQSAFGPPMQPRLDQLRQVFSVVTVLVWVATLWRYQPMPTPDTATELEHDYMVLAQQTAQAIAKARAQIFRVFMP